MGRILKVDVWPGPLLEEVESEQLLEVAGSDSLGSVHMVMEQEELHSSIWVHN